MNGENYFEVNRNNEEGIRERQSIQFSNNKALKFNKEKHYFQNGVLKSDEQEYINHYDCGCAFLGHPGVLTNSGKLICPNCHVYCNACGKSLQKNVESKQFNVTHFCFDCFDEIATVNIVKKIGDAILSIFVERK